MDKKTFKRATLGGILENPVFVLMLGICPIIAVSKSFMDAFLMGLSVTFVLMCSNTIISIFRKMIPGSVRLPAYIMIIATFTTALQLFLDKYMPDFYNSVGRFIALIAVNCIIFARAEAFASKNGVLSSLVDGTSMGIGYILAISLLGGVRQLLGEVLKISIFVQPAGGFIVFGLMMALFNALISWAKSRAANKAASIQEKEAEREQDLKKEQAAQPDKAVLEDAL